MPAHKVSALVERLERQPIGATIKLRDTSKKEGWWTRNADGWKSQASIQMTNEQLRDHMVKYGIVIIHGGNA